MTATPVAPAPLPVPPSVPSASAAGWTSRGYHVMTHSNTEEVMLATNAVRRVEAGASFYREGNALRWRPDPSDPQGWSFDGLPENVWDAIRTGRCFLVEFGPTGPLTEHDVVLRAHP